MSEARHRHCVTKNVGLSRVQATPGSRAIGLRTGATTGGSQDDGTVRRTKAHIGTILTTITNGKAGNCMKGIGITRTTTETTKIMASTMITITNCG